MCEKEMNSHLSHCDVKMSLDRRGGCGRWTMSNYCIGLDGAKVWRLDILEMIGAPRPHNHRGPTVSSESQTRKASLLEPRPFEGSVLNIPLLYVASTFPIAKETSRPPKALVHCQPSSKISRNRLELPRTPQHADSNPAFHGPLRLLTLANTFCTEALVGAWHG